MIVDSHWLASVHAARTTTTYAWRWVRSAPTSNGDNPLLIRVAVRLGFLVLIGIGVGVYRVSAKWQLRIGKTLLGVGSTLALPLLVVIWTGHLHRLQGWSEWAVNSLFITGGAGILFVLTGASFWYARSRLGAGRHPAEIDRDAAPAIDLTPDVSDSPGAGRHRGRALLIIGCAGLIIPGIAFAVFRPRHRGIARTRPTARTFAYVRPLERKSDPGAIRAYLATACQLIDKAAADHAPRGWSADDMLDRWATDEQAIAGGMARALAGDGSGAVEEVYHVRLPPDPTSTVMQPAMICLAADDMNTAFTIADGVAARLNGDSAAHRVTNHLWLLRFAHTLGDEGAIQQTIHRLLTTGPSVPAGMSPADLDQVVSRIAHEQMSWGDFEGARATAGRVPPSIARDHLLDEIDRAEDTRPAPAGPQPAIDPVAEAAKGLSWHNRPLFDRVTEDLKTGSLDDIEAAATEPSELRVQAVVWKVFAIASARRHATSASARGAKLAIAACLSRSDQQALMDFAVTIAREQGTHDDRQGADATFTAAAEAIESIHNVNDVLNGQLLDKIARAQVEFGNVRSAAQWAAGLTNPYHRKQVRLAMAEALLHRATERDTVGPLPALTQ